jgi:predicted ester cyclase
MSTNPFGAGLFADFYNANDPQAAAGLVAERVSDSFVDHAPIFGAATDKAGFGGAVSAMNAAFRQDYVVEHLVSEGQMHVAIWRSQATHVGALLGVEPTGKTFTVRGITAYAVENGLITAHWEQFDAVTILTELGIIPAMGA